MNLRYFTVFCFAFAGVVVGRAVYADKEDASGESLEEQLSSEADLNATVSEPEAAPDSHEAMNNREQKKLGGREKRSFEFLLGLVNNNSRLQVTDTEEDVDAVTAAMRRNKVTSNDIGASELLLELLVKIAAHPDQWEQVHNLLQKIDRDLKTSKKIFNQLQTSKANEETNANDIHLDKKEIILNNDISQHAIRKTTTPIPQATITIQTDSTKEVLKTDQWSPIKLETTSENPQDLTTTKYPWEIPSKSTKNEKYPRNFAYHRVTGNPTYHANMDNNPKAYIAVSVIAPKQTEDIRPNDELLLENELRQLKPWTHNQNLKNMASLRSRWVIQSENKNKGSYTP